ncbi:unnamed protein product [Cyclocybe aegerita]|uniref:Uncharacterized protein n=1 Tax=Cyclocybe aegerita TaxID=1973307 RepID=A0A8S0XR72_CYCAE|nr:unnamed protein product [Cyclocybe aegerita]
MDNQVEIQEAHEHAEDQINLPMDPANETDIGNGIEPEREYDQPEGHRGRRSISPEERQNLTQNPSGLGQEHAHAQRDQISFVGDGTLPPGYTTFPPQLRVDLALGVVAAAPAQILTLVQAQKTPLVGLILILKLESQPMSSHTSRTNSIPLGPQLQALKRSTDTSAALSYHAHKVVEVVASQNRARSHADLIYDDIFSGRDVLDLSERLSLTENDITVSFSLDGAQLYQTKKSDTWIAIWIVTDYDPSTRYKRKHVLPAAVIPGPNKPKNIDSFMFRSFYHLSALQREKNGRGLRIWDALQKKTIDSRIIFILGTADAVALTEFDGRVGHHGAQGCRLSCDMKGPHKPSSGHYFAAHLRPNKLIRNYAHHPDYNFHVMPSLPSPESYQAQLEQVIMS